MVVGRLLSYWEGNFSGAMLNFGRVSLMIPQFLRPTLSCMVHPHQPSKVQGWWCCKVVMVIWFQKVIVGESYKNANRFQEFWDCWKFSKHDSEIRIHYYIKKSFNLQVIFWTLGFTSHFTTLLITADMGRSFGTSHSKFFTSQAVWDVLISMLIIYSAGGELGEELVSNYSDRKHDLFFFPLKGSVLGGGNGTLISGKSRLVKYNNLARSLNALASRPDVCRF